MRLKKGKKNAPAPGAKPPGLTCNLVIPIRDGVLAFDDIEVTNLNQTMTLNALKGVFMSGIEAVDKAFNVRIAKAGIHIFREKSK